MTYHFNLSPCPLVALSPCPAITKNLLTETYWGVKSPTVSEPIYQCARQFAPPTSWRVTTSIATLDYRSLPLLSTNDLQVSNWGVTPLMKLAPQPLDNALSALVSALGALSLPEARSWTCD